MAVRQMAGDERGTTLVELMVGLMMGMVILSGLTLVVITTMHGSARVSARVEATQNGRVVLARVTEEMHSACVYPKLAPVKGTSTGTSLRFIHAAQGQGAAPAPTPVESRIALSNGTLTQFDYPLLSGTTPQTWVFATTPTPASGWQLLTDVAPIPGASTVFTYYSYANGGLSTLTAGPEQQLGTTNAEKTIQVKIALNASPRSTPVADTGADASIQDAAVLRLTPPSFNENATAVPCQ